ncbi:NTPase KAP [Capnocytophaga ochracea]|uniref:NTPase KAP n=1 Tax=Capnocytophaga ochracea TaxID=1018 RepID=UPI002B48FE90|nr:NTPase KAP [Capnocytophaga ochracea]MEB3035505.1 NTPase KAP [Capnocytophaga ochracea]
MDNIINVVKDYLTRETNNALLITGEWGVGKTYFFENTLNKKIEEVSIKENESVKYKPIRVSLSGVISIDDIERRIVAELYPSLNKGLKWGKGIFKFLLSTPKIKEYIPEIPNSDLIDSETDNLVICFDDLERKSKTFPIDSLIGYINNLTENSNLKIIIIGNTDKIKESFDEIKEKLIGREIEYKINIEEVFDTLIHNESQSFSEYTKFLQKEKNFICSFFQDYKNIRTLKFILTRYHDIHSQIEIIAPNIEYIQSNKNTVLKDALLFTIAISIEHKGGNVTRNSKDEIDNKFRITQKDIRRLLNDKSSSDEKKDEEETILEIIKSKYYNENNFSYFFYESIFNYIVGINILDKDLLDKDIKEKYKISEDNSIPECYITYNRINSDEVFSMTNASYKQLLTDMLSYVDNGEYRLEHYNRIYILVLSFNNPLKIKEDKLKNRIIKGMKKNKDKFAYNPELPNKLLYIKGGSDVDKNEKEIIDLCLTINNEKEQEKYKQDSTNLINILKNDFDHFEHQVKHKYNNIPIFAYINSKTISEFYNDKRDLRIRLFEVFNHRYIYYGEGVLKKEKGFYLQLQQSIEKKASKLQSGPEWYSYNKFNKLLKKIIDIAK